MSADAPVTLREMQFTADRLAHRIITSQAAMVKAGLRDVPHRGEMRDARVLEAVAAMVAAIIADEVIVKRLQWGKQQ